MKHSPPCDYASLFPEEMGILGAHLEIGNWYGFASLPTMGGLGALFAPSMQRRARRQLLWQGELRLPRGRFQVQLESRREEGVVRTSASARALAPSLFGDIALQLRFSERFTIDEAPLPEAELRYAPVSAAARHKLVVGPWELAVEETLRSSPSRSTVRHRSYAARLPGRGARYHTRAVVVGGSGARLLLRGRGSLSCVEIGPCPAPLTPLLYGKERFASWQPFRNTQLCAAVELAAGDTITLEQHVSWGAG